MKKITLTISLLIITIISYAQLSWLKLPDFPGTGKVGCSSFSLNGKGYMGLGFDTLVHASTDWYEFDPASNTWTQKASLPALGRWTCVNLTINNKGYVITGALNSGYTNETWEYDPLSNTWAPKTNFPGSARQNGAGFSINGKGYVGTGYNGGGSLNDFYEYDPVLDSWTSKANYPGAIRNGAAGFSIGNEGYMGLGNGTNSAVNYNDFYQYNPLNDQWIQKSDFPITYINVPTAFSSSTDGYILCGYYYQNIGISHNPLNTLYSYDPSTNAWTLEGTFRGLPRGYAGGFSLTNDIYICSGAQSNDGDPALILTDLWKLSNGLTLIVGNTGSDIDLALFPNPVSTTVNIPEDLAGKRIKQIRIYDAAGKLVLNLCVNDNRSINISMLRNGIYFVELITEDKEVLDSRFVKE